MTLERTETQRSTYVPDKLPEPPGGYAENVHCKVEKLKRDTGNSM